MRVALVDRARARRVADRWRRASETARLTGNGRSVSRRMPGTSPTVEMVSLRADRPMSPCMRSTDAQTAAFVGQRFAHAHEHDVAEASVHRSCLARAATTCSTISPTVRCRPKPAWPVAQNPQPIAQPTWLLTQTVTRSGYNISTVSIRLPSCNSQRYFTVSPPSLTRRTTTRNAGVSRSLERCPQRLREVGHLGGRRELLVQALPDLIEPIARFAVQ